MSDVNDSVRREANRIVSKLGAFFEKRVDGREAVRWMKESGSSNWRQMEWIGFYFEESALTVLDIEQGASINNTVFDACGEYVWDFKTHTVCTPSGNKRYEMYLNDAASIEECVSCDGIGFIVAYVKPEYDTGQSFYSWHEELKESGEAYNKRQSDTSTASRVRKSGFVFDKIESYWIDDMEMLESACREGWMREAVQGVNSGGNERKSKYKLYPHRVPCENVIASFHFTESEDLSKYLSNTELQ